MSRSRLALALKKLTLKELIRTEDQVNAVLLAAAEPILMDLGRAQQDFELARFAGFQEEELIQYAYFSNRIKKNIQHVLKKEGVKEIKNKNNKINLEKSEYIYYDKFIDVCIYQ